MQIIHFGHHVSVAPRVNSIYGWAHEDPALFYSAPVGHPDNLVYSHGFLLSKIIKAKYANVTQRDMGLTSMIEKVKTWCTNPTNDQIVLLFAIPHSTSELWQSESGDFYEISTCIASTNNDLLDQDFNLWKIHKEYEQTQLQFFQELNDFYLWTQSHNVKLISYSVYQENIDCLPVDLCMQDYFDNKVRFDTQTVFFDKQQQIDWSKQLLKVAQNII